MDTKLSEDTTRLLGDAYADLCMERNPFAYRFTDWRGEQAKRLAQIRARSLESFDAAHETSMEDVMGLELAECYRALDEKDVKEARRRLARAAAALIRGIRHLDVAYADESNG